MKLDPVKNYPHLYRHPKTDIYYFCMFRKGKGRLERSLRTTNKSKAIIEADKVRADFLNEEPELRKTKRILSEEWADWLKLQKTKSEATYYSKEMTGRLYLLPYFGEYFPREITAALWEEYILHWKKNAELKNTAPRTLFNDRKHLNEFLGHLVAEQKLKQKPKLRNPDSKSTKGKVYTQDQIKNLLRCALQLRPAKAGSKVDGAALHLQILCAATMGMRKSEILTLEWWQIDLDKKTIHLPKEKTKTRKKRTFGISDEAYPFFKALESRSGFVFTHPEDPDQNVGRNGNKTAWSQCREKTGISGRFHDLRHTFLTRAFKAYWNPAFICNYAGLTLQEAEETYLHIDEEDTRPVASLIRFDTESDQKSESSAGKLRETGLQ